MKRSVLLILFFSTLLHAQKPSGNYSQLWQEVEQFELDNLPKSANIIVAKIYTKAKRDNNAPQLIKSLLYQSKFALLLEENAQLNVIHNFEKEIAKADFPTKNILESVVAKLYWQYFQQNRWKFYNRTKTTKKVDTADFRTWDLETLFKEVHIHFQNSLQNGLLSQQTNLRDFEDILHNTKGAKEYRPTLFDFLVHNALEFYKTDETHLTKPAYKFEIDNAQYLSDIDSFLKLNIEAKDSMSLQYHALLLYQKLSAFHSKDKDPGALVMLDLERMAFVRNHATFSDKDAVYLQALIHSEKQFKSSAVRTLYAFEIATLYHQQGQNYHPKKSTENQWKIKEALAICKEAISDFPESRGAQKCQVLQETIQRPKLNLTAEKFIVPNRPARILVKHKNTDKVYFKAIKISEKKLKSLQKTYDKKEQLAFIQKLKVTKEWTAQIRDESDYQMHSSEVVVPKLAQGNYLFFASPNKDKIKSFAFTDIQVTDIALIETQSSQQQILQVVDRYYGNPLQGAKVHLTNYEVNRYSEKIDEVLITDDFGRVYLPNDHRYSNVKATVTYADKKGVFGSYHIREYHKAKQNRKDYYQAFLFTDRSIYRPGQTLYFKGIVVTKKPKEKRTLSEVLVEEKVSVFLSDVNGEEVGRLELLTNEFGSVSGEFILPDGGLTGQYTLGLRGDGYRINTQTRLSVEEYKRPKFETEFKPITDSYKILDTVKVIGTATAYAGSAITDAKVVYRVHRKVQYPRWWYWYRPMHSSEPQEITHGETTTDAEGNYEILFKALPDKSVAKKDLPVFHYEITADITDVNGETRSSKTNVKVGYHSVLAHLNAPANWDQQKKEQDIHITTTNLNGEKVAVAGVVKIYKLKAPISPKRKRPWETPDYQNIDRENFIKLFPQESFSDEDEEKYWKNGKLVYSEKISTSAEKETKLTLNRKGSKGYKKWTPGKYQVVLETQDKFGQKLTDKQFVTIYNAEEDTVADAKLLRVQADKDSYESGDVVRLSVGSAANNVRVFIVVEKDYKVIKTHLVQLNNEVKYLEIPVEKNDIGGFSISYYMTKYNSFVNGKIGVHVPFSIKNLEIETLTFRDKIQPGSEQTWSFKLKGLQKDKFAAEVLASMYDASLDQFKTHRWNKPIGESVHSYYPSFRSNAGRSFYNTNLNFSNLDKIKYSRYPKAIGFDRLNWFGLHINNKWFNNQYLSSIRNKYRLSNDESFKKGFVKGVVSDETGPLPGVSVRIKGSSQGTETDFDGLYEIKVNKGDVLVFSYVGMETVSIIVGDKNVVGVVMLGSNVLDEVVITSYGGKRNKRAMRMEAPVAVALEGKVSGVQEESDAMHEEEVVIRGSKSLNGNSNALIIIDGKIVSKQDFEALDPNDVASMKVLKGAEATALYGPKAANGVVVVTTKEGQAKLNAELSTIQTRTNFDETAFFYPHLQTDKEGNISFNFTIPEALTRWKLQLLGHDKHLKTAYQSLTTVTQKDLMVLPNPPRFLREGDYITFSSKITNLSDTSLSGNAQLVLTDAITGKDINSLLQNTEVIKAFSLDAKGNTSVSWNLHIPETIQAVQYKIVAKAGDFSDGEQNILPVLTNRMLVTETLPMWVNSNETKTFTLSKLKDNKSTTLRNHRLTLEVTSNPVWYAVQALPYLMEYPYECSEQTFSRYYANAIASDIVNRNPKIKHVFDQWKNTDALRSNLEKNQELKSLLIQETPWLRDAKSETEQKKRIALLFDLNKMNNELKKATRKLKKMQMSNGGFPWFKGSRYPNRYITQHIATGFGHLKKLNIKSYANDDAQDIARKAIKYLDGELLHDYHELLKQARKIKERANTKEEGIKEERKYLASKHVWNLQLQYLYMRSFYKDIPIGDNLQTAVDYYTQQAYTYWNDFKIYQKGLIALVAHRNDKSSVANAIVRSLDENSITSEELGMYWKENQPSWYWYQAPIETQALMIETFAEIQNKTKTIDNLKKWLLKNKQTNRWKTTKATTEAVYALLGYGTDWTETNELVEVKIGNETLNPMDMEAVKVEAGTGYFKTAWSGGDIQPEQATVTLTKKTKGLAWGALYWQYFEDLDKITHAKTPLQITKKLFLKKNVDTGEEITEINDASEVKVGDVVRVRIELKVDREMDFVHMKDMRASGFEPVNVLSQYKYQDGLGYYESTKDASTNFFFDHLRKGVYVFEYDLRANNAGDFSNGITSIQCMYAPEFTSHSVGVRLNIKN